MILQAKSVVVSGFSSSKFYKVKLLMVIIPILESQLRQEMFLGLNVMSFQIGEHNIAVMVLSKASAINKPGTHYFKCGSSEIWLGCVPF